MRISPVSDEPPLLPLERLSGSPLNSSFTFVILQECMMASTSASCAMFPRCSVTVLITEVADPRHDLQTARRFERTPAVLHEVSNAGVRCRTSDKGCSMESLPLKLTISKASACTRYCDQSRLIFFNAKWQTFSDSTSGVHHRTYHFYSDFDSEVLFEGEPSTVDFTRVVATAIHHGDLARSIKPRSRHLAVWSGQASPEHKLAFAQGLLAIKSWACQALHARYG